MKNIGDKIKNIASVILALGIVAEICVIINAVLGGDEDSISFAILIPLIIWLAYAILYGFGELIEKVSKIEENTRGGNIKHEFRPRNENIQCISFVKPVCASCGNTNRPDCKFCEKCGAPLKK